MAISTITLASLVKAVRVSIENFIVRPFGDEAIEAVLNGKQSELFLEMPYEMKKQWYGMVAKTTTLTDDTTNSGMYVWAKPANFFDLVSLNLNYTEDGDTKKITLEEVDMASIPEYWTNELLTERKAYSILGSNIYTYVTTAVLSAISGTLYLFYIKQPTDMDSSNAMDLPPQFRQVLVASTAAEIITTVKLDSEARDTILQMFAMKEKRARELAGLPLGSKSAEMQELAQLGYPIGESGAKGSHAGTEAS